MNCGICKAVCNLPYKLNCGDTFCYLCIKLYTIDIDIKCPICSHLIVDDLNNLKIYDTEGWENCLNVPYLWMYSTRYGTSWWCYDPISNTKVETLYKNYIHGKEIVSGTTNMDTLDAQIDYNLGSHSDAWIDDDNNTIATGEYDPYQCPESDDTQDCEVIYCDSLDSDNESDDESYVSSQLVLTYELDIGHAKYVINFNTMRQYNANDSSKQRSIRRIDMNEIRQANIEVITTLKNVCNVRGIAGLGI